MATGRFTPAGAPRGGQRAAAALLIGGVLGTQACLRSGARAQAIEAETYDDGASGGASIRIPAASDDPTLLSAPGPSESMNVDQNGRAPIVNQRLFADMPRKQFAVYGVSNWTAVDACSGPTLASLASWQRLYDNQTDDLQSICAFQPADHVQLERPQVVVTSAAQTQYFSFVKAVPIGAVYGSNPYLFAKLAILRAPAFAGPWQVVRCVAPTWDGGPSGAGVTMVSGQSAGISVGAGALYVGDLAADIDPTDGQGYLVFSAGYLPEQGTWSGKDGLQVNWLHLVGLTPDYMDLAKSLQESVVSGREAPVLFRTSAGYGVASSATVGWGGSNTVIGRGQTYLAALADHDRRFPAGAFDPGAVGMDTFGGQVSGVFDLGQSGRPLLVSDVWSGPPTYASLPHWMALGPDAGEGAGALYPGAFYIDTLVGNGRWGPLGTGCGWGPDPMAPP